MNHKVALCLSAGFCFSAAAHSATIVVDAKTVIFAAAGNGNPDKDGLVPTTIPLPAGVGRTLTLELVTGEVSPAGPPFLGPPDGAFFADASPHVFDYNGISGIIDNGKDNVMALMGVFTAGVPDPATRPPTRNITNDKNLAVMPTIVNQPFFMGDGRWSGGVQVFLIPDDATGLSFGFADAIGGSPGIYQGPPGAYVDNFGSLTVNYAVVVPETGTASLLLAGMMVTVSRRRRRARA